MSDSVAIIMRSKNEMPYLRAVLEALRHQSHAAFEFYAVDSGSTDGSREALRAFCAPGRLTCIEPAAYVPGAVLNTAIERTGQEIIVLLNGDAVPQSDSWLERLLQPILANEADATFSRQTARPDARFIVDYDYRRAYASGPTSEPLFSAAACAFRRSLWEQHPFRSEGYAEDAIWASVCRLFNARFRLVPDSVVEHSHNYTLRQLYQKRFRHGLSFAQALGHTVSPGQRLLLCGREAMRDFLYACRRLRPDTIPYNLTYRITIHAGMQRGLKEGTS